MHRRPSPTPLATISIALLGVLLAPILLAPILLAPTLAHAQAPMPMGPTAPPADAFDIRYYTTNADGSRGRALDSVDFTRFVNKARCECGHQISARIVLKPAMGTTYNLSTQIQSFVGTTCNTAEAAPVGQFRRCIKLKTGNAPQFQNEYNTNFHPIWLSSGVALASGEDRDPSSALAAGDCNSRVEGQSGIWMCADTNGMPNCQSDEFFITGSQNNNLPAGMASGIKYDYLPPLTIPTGLAALPGDSAVIVTWGALSGDIVGFRVLCEEADTGKPPAGRGYSPKAITAKQDGTIYYTKENLCPDGPFSTFKAGNDNPLDPGSTAGDTTTTDGNGTTTDDSGTTTDDSGTTGGTTGGTTDSTTGGSSTDTDGSSGSGGTSLTCGDGVVDAGEECDDGEDNGDDKACHSTCLEDVCGDALKGPKEGCDNGEANADTGLCGTDCKLNGSAGLTSLDWSYVCTGHLGIGSTSARIEGLENDKKYNFLLVAYDVAGNPFALDTIVTAAPVDTRDLWEQCKADGDVCGDSGFCNVAGDPRGDQLLGLGALFGLGLGVRGLIRRSRRKRA